MMTGSSTLENPRLFNQFLRDFFGEDTIDVSDLTDEEVSELLVDYQRYSAWLENAARE